MPPPGYSKETYRPVVLVSCGSFNPPTNMHLRMLELATEAMVKVRVAALAASTRRPACTCACWSWQQRPCMAKARVAALAAPALLLSGGRPRCRLPWCTLPPPGSQGLARAVHALACAACPPLLLGQRTAWAPPQAGSDVLGCYLSPVNDTYWKKGLAPGTQRVAMCQLAAADSGAHGSNALPAPAVAAHRPGAHSCRRHNHV